MFHSEFSNGYWCWDDVRNAVFYNKITEPEKLPAYKHESAIAGLQEANVSTLTAVKFRDLINRVSQAQFKRLYRRKVKPGASDIVIIQDVKDVVLFSAEVKDLSSEFIRFFHLPTMDAFLRAAIVYFQYFFQIWDHVEQRREDAKRKLTQPIVTVLEDKIMDNIGDLRSILSREYHRLTCGMTDARKFYHLNNKNNVSTSDKDRRLFEAFMCVAVRVIWWTLHRKNFSLIETELNRLLRTKVFNLIEHRPKRVDTFDLTQSEKRYVWGKACRDEKKLKHRSPAAQELMFATHDYKMLAIGITHIETNDPRHKFLEIAYTAPEEKLFSLGVGLGLLGYPRDRLDTLLKPRERTKTDVLGEELIVPPFNLPPKQEYEEIIISQSLPQAPPKYSETSDTKRNRKVQMNLWLKHVECCGNISLMVADTTASLMGSSIHEPDSRHFDAD
ncbi:protein phosphatase 1 regulatory subunit 36-like [Coccinella septempunctata]|uniref:protein phosphatase 1 regulatory subunit 36-like n=1 Tax=Coccinella septempunctata TaxID=41139 RepID=UPI001D08A449|nr:protein phosphatase 1 regulatory subunit 36-like [Coccinella septempunctata]